MTRLCAQLRVPCALLILFAPPLAGAAVTFDAVGDSQTITYNGFINSASLPDPGLSAQATFTLASMSGTGVTLSVLLDNTSTIFSRVSSFGFDITPDLMNAVAGPMFTTYVPGGHVPGYGDVAACFSAKNTCNGGGGDGISSVDAPVSITLNLTFASPTASFALDNFVVRYQSVGADQQDSGAGFGHGDSPVPEPSTIGLIGAGLLMLACCRGRRGTGRGR